jgi:Ni/Fe-hydrogenase subunit HybB-like protein
LQELGRVLVVVLWVYAALRLEDLLNRGVLKLTLRPSYEMYLFWVEMALTLILPLILLSQRKVRNSPGGLYLAAVLVVLGFVTNRLNVSITGMEASAGTHYIPKWTELAVTGAIIAAGFALFGLAAKYLPIFPEEEHAAERTPKHEVQPVAAAVLHHAGD